jgi:hypothetical protein
MIRQAILLVLLTIALFSLSLPSGLQAAEQYGWGHGHYRGPIPYYIGNPKTINPDKVTPPLYRSGVASSSPSTQREASPRAYPYGYFGAQYRPYVVTGSNYYNDFSQLSLRRGY